ncbi:MAG TPA: hypothetical protein ACFCUY_10390 [Xenococcaceae cyanobacterium]
MKKFQHTPAFWRYFGARLKPFTNPLFISSVGFFALSGIVIYQYWQHPDWLQNQIEKPLGAVFSSREAQEIPQISEADLATAADIDNIDLLLQEIEKSQPINPLNVAPDQTKKVEKDTPDSEFSRFKAQQKDKFKNISDANPNYLSLDSVKDSAVEQLLKPPALTNYSSPISNQTQENLTSNNSNSSDSTTTSDPIGRLYFSNRNSALVKNGNLGSSLTSRTSPLSKLGDGSGNLNLRKLESAPLPTENTSNGVETLPNQTTGATTPNEALNQPPTVNNSNGLNSTALGNNQPQSASETNNLPTGFTPATSSNTSGNQNTVNNQSNSYSPRSNSNRYSVPTPNYNQSAPSNYQLQPQNFGQQNPRDFNQVNSFNSNPFNFNPAGNSDSEVGNQSNNNNALSNPITNPQVNNSPATNSLPTGQLNNQPQSNQVPRSSFGQPSPLLNSPLLKN